MLGILTGGASGAGNAKITTLSEGAMSLNFQDVDVQMCLFCIIKFTVNFRTAAKTHMRKYTCTHVTVEKCC